MTLLAAYSLVVIARHAVFWLKHRPMPQHYDNKGRLQPNRIESFLLAAFALWPAWFYLALEIPLWLCAVFAVPLYFLGKLALFRWWLPHKQRQESQL